MGPARPPYPQNLEHRRTPTLSTSGEVLPFGFARLSLILMVARVTRCPVNNLLVDLLSWHNQQLSLLFLQISVLVIYGDSTHGPHSLSSLELPSEE